MLYEQEVQAERAILVGVQLGTGGDWPLEESLAELGRLVNTAGAVVVDTVTQKLESINPRTFIGPGKAEEISALTRSLNADLVVFDDELSPSQQSNLEKICRDVKVIDRTALILDIFALHATTREGRLQVRLAQNQYLYPRLRGMWAHLASNRMGGGVGSRFGEGESQLEVDRRMVRNRITAIRRELKDLERTRGLQRKSREKGNVFRVSLAGYTNAGKSSLINALTGSDTYVCDQLFATLDSTTRRLDLPQGSRCTLTDTVGFIQKLPHSLVEAFKSTLDEIVESDLILHVVDASSPMREEQIASVEQVLHEIGAEKIPRVLVYNKIDLLDEGERKALPNRAVGCILTSAVERTGLDELLAVIDRYATQRDTEMAVLIPYAEGALSQLAHEECVVRQYEYLEEGIRMRILVPARFRTRFEPYAVSQ